LQPRHINSHYYLGLSYAQGFQRYGEAVALIEKAISVGYNGDDKYVNLGVTYGMKGAYNKALEAFLMGIKDGVGFTLWIKDEDVYQAVGRNLERAG